MPDLIESPAVNPRYAGLKPFDHTRATLAGQRSGQVRRERAGLQPVKAAPVPPASQVQSAINAQLRLVSEQITRTRAVLNDDDAAYCEQCERGGMPPHHRAQLLKALDTLLDRQRKLLGIHDPGPIKAREPRGNGAGQPYAMLEEAKPACGVDTTIDSSAFDCGL